MYTVDYFIKKFQAIPEENIVTGTFRFDENKRCSLGHCMSNDIIELVSDAGYDKDGSCMYKPTKKDIDGGFNEVFALSKIIGNGNARKGSEMTININNGDDHRYQQATPKQRILAALYDKKMQEGQEGRYPDITKSLAVLPVQETTDTKTDDSISEEIPEDYYLKY